MRIFKWSIILMIILLIALILLSPGLISANSYTEKTTYKQGITHFFQVANAANPTPTPFQPLPPTPTYLPDVEVRSIKAKPTQDEEESSNIPAPVPTFPAGSRFNFLLLGFYS